MDTQIGTNRRLLLDLMREDARAALTAVPAPPMAREAEQAAEIERLTELLREAYPYLPMAISLAEELAEMFPDIARPYDRTTPPAPAPERGEERQTEKTPDGFDTVRGEEG